MVEKVGGGMILLPGEGRMVELDADYSIHLVGLFGLFKYQSHYRPVTHPSGVVEKSGKTSTLPVSGNGR